MSELLPITEAEQLTLAIFSMLGNDAAAVKVAKEFVGSSQLNLQLLQMSISESVNQAQEQLNNGNIDWVVVARKAVDSAQHKLTAFN